MNFLTIAQACAAGFLASLIVLDLLRWCIGEAWPEQRSGLQLERRLLPWALAIAAGPGLMWDATAAYRRREAGTAYDLAAILVVMLLWSASYGLCLIAALRFLAG
ncbi:hypothetical protein [Gellertiella hungarica]|uniref:Small neutral amino acid transporter SnatA (MarC family) n=1 Tax=Gellertiella hungarica TaxID=1572859 RepID=A0A7W6J4Y0_9HYPH|nr:hypothetical protein [Gellertiella hungarica]MBB4064879.1 small neutral amino acid transporter SnatA (MarC family) [Gellertiella hungarica]